MNKLQWSLVRLGEWLGGPGVLALVLLLCALAYPPVMLWPAQDRLALFETGLVQASQVAQPVAPSSVSTFLAAFPPADSLSAQLQSIFDIAAQNNLELGEVSYKRERTKGERLQRYHVNFSIEAPYPDARAFLADVLAAQPHVALSQLSFNRDSVKEDSEQTNIRLTLYLVR